MLTELVLSEGPEGRICSGLLLSGVLQWSLVLASNQRLHLAMTGQSGNEDGAEKRELAGPALPSSGQMQACGEW